MKVVFVHHFSLNYIGGGERFLVETCELLRRKGHSIELRAFPIHRSGKMVWNIPPGVRYIESWFHNVDDADVIYFVYAPAVWRLVKTSVPKIAGIHAPPLVPELQSKDVFPRSPIKLIKFHGLLSTFAYYYFKFFKSKELSRFNAIHAINPAMRFDHPNVYHIPLFIDTRLYRPTKPKSEEPIVLFVGRPLFKKGFDLFVEAAKIVRKYVNNVRFLATGVSGVVNGIVEGLGKVDDNTLIDLYSYAWITVYPSRIDTFGRVIIESMSSGTPVITTPIPAHTHLRLPLSYASTSEEIAKEILNILSMTESEYTDLCNMSRRAVVEQYDVEKIFPKFEEMLKEVAHGSFGYR